MAYPPRYKKIDGLWYVIYITSIASKKEGQGLMPKKGRKTSFSYRLVKLAKSYRAKGRLYSLYRRGKERGVVYTDGTPSPKNPVPPELKKWKSKSKHSYKIVRYYEDKPNRTVKKGVTLEDARKHCSKKSSRGRGWFDGYTKM
jgi:hypothetical protein